MLQIAVTSRTFSTNENLVSSLGQYFPDSRVNQSGPVLAGETLREFLSGCTGAIVGTEKLDRAVLDELPDLRVVAKYGVGLDSLDTPALKERGIYLGWSGGVNRRSVSELALSAMLGLARNVFSSCLGLKNGLWVKSGGFELSGKCVGIVGCGFIGSDLLRLLQPFGCRLLINDVQDKSDVARQFGAVQVELPTLLRASHFVTLHTPLTFATHHLIGTAELDQMRSDAFLINTARGGIVDEQALKEALRSNTIRGAFLDVFEQEPVEDQALVGLPGLMGSAHIGGNSAEAVAAMGKAAIDNLLLGLKEQGLYDERE